MRVAVLGAGRIGCGFLVPLLRARGHEVVLVARDHAVADSIRRHGGWRLRTLHLAGGATETAVDCREVVQHDDPQALAAIAGCEVALVAVGADDLAALVPLLAGVLAGHHVLRDVVVVENGLDTTAALAPAFTGGDARCGLSSGLVTRVVSRREGDPRQEAPLVFVGDDVGELLVDARRLHGALPHADEIVAVADHEDAVRRKLYTFNAGHAAAAYLGALQGYHYIHSAVRDPEIAEVVRGAMQEADEGMLARYGPPQRPTDPPTAHLERFLLPLDDEVGRVGRQPLRKLRPHDRLVAPAGLALASGRVPVCLALACAGALLFEGAAARRAGADAGFPPAAGQVGRAGAVFLAVTGQGPTSALGRLVHDALGALHDPRLPSGSLPSPRDGSWGGPR